MLWALGQPVAFAGLVLSFVVSLLIRRGVHYLSSAPWRSEPAVRAVFFRPRRDIDPYGAIAALVGGVGWGKAADERTRGDVRALWLGPLTVLFTSQVCFAAYRSLNLNLSVWALASPSDVLRGLPGQFEDQFMFSLAVGLLTFALVDLIPIPPLDGWGILAHAQRRPGPGFSKARYWLEDHNIGVAILLASLLLPIFDGLPPLLFLLDFVATPVLRLWS